MQKFGKTIITNSGRKMLVEVDGAKGQLTYTRAALFKQDIKGFTEEDQIALSELSGQQIETPLEVTQIQDTTVTVSASFNNSKVSQDLPFNTIGWYAKTSVDNVEQLMAVTPSLTGQILVAGVEGASTSALDIDMVFGRSHNTTVVLSPNQAGVVSAPQLAASIQKLKIELKELGLLNDSDGNNIYNTTINLDTYSTVGITKFLECKLQSSGQMSGFDQATDKLYGWILNVPKWDGATEFQQIVYICDYGQGTLSYVRSRINNSGTNKEDFEKVLTDKDLQKAINSFGQTKSVNGVKPDSTGNISIEIPSDYVKSVNSQAPDSNGNVNVDTGGVKTINGKNGDVQVPVYASNLIDGTSNYNQTVTGTNALLSTTKVPAQVGDTFSAQLWIDNTKSTSGDDMVALWAYNSGDTALYAVKGNVISQGSAGYSKVDMTVTNANVSYLTLHLSGTGTTVREAKVAKWQDANTSPDMTWVPTIEDYRADYTALSEKIDVGDDIEDIGRKLADKANASDVYSKSQADSKFGGAIKSIDGYYPDSQGRYYLANTYETINNVSTKVKKKLSNLSNPDYSYTGTTLDVDNIANPGVYFFEKTKLSSSMNSHTFDDVLSLPYNCGYLIVDDCYFISTRCQAQFLLNFNLNNPAISIYVRLIMPGAGAYGTKFKAIVS